MGFFSFVGDVASSIGNAVSSAVDTVGSAISSGWSEVKKVAGRALEWVAENGQQFVGAVKKTWEAVKPYMETIRSGIRTAAAFATSHGMPWLGAALTALDSGIGALTKFSDSPIAKKISQAIEWALEIAKRWKNSEEKQREQDQKEDPLLKEHELEKARRYQEDLRLAEREAMSNDEERAISLASVINDYAIANADLTKTLEGTPENFEHYLRLRATQKLLKMSKNKFQSAKTIDDLSADDIFVVRIASDLIKNNPELGKIAAERLDKILVEKHGKKLTPFVYEELVAAWSAQANDARTQWDTLNRNYSRNMILQKRLQVAKKVQQELSEEEMKELEKLEEELPETKKTLDAIDRQERDCNLFAGATEGFLQLLEKDEDQIKKDDQEYLLDDGQRVGMLLIDCAEHSKAFSELNAEEQELIIDFSNIFKQDAQNRSKKILEVTA